jgi:hypothetical protein
MVALLWQTDYVPELLVNVNFGAASDLTIRGDKDNRGFEPIPQTMLEAYPAAWVQSGGVMNTNIVIQLPEAAAKAVRAK